MFIFIFLSYGGVGRGGFGVCGAVSACIIAMVTKDDLLRVHPNVIKYITSLSCSSDTITLVELH